jgi:hypothetical protein
MGREKELTKSLPTRMSPAERPLIRKAASTADLSESRFLVTAALLLSDFGSVEELRSAIRLGRFLIDARLAAVMQVRLAGNQLKLLRAELKAAGQVVPERLEKAVDEATAALKNLGASWRGPSAK